MNLYNWLQPIFYMVVLLALTKPLGTYMAHVYEGRQTLLHRVLSPIEQLVYRFSGVNPSAGSGNILGFL